MYLSLSTYRYRYILRKTLFLWREQIQEFYRSVQQKQVLSSLTFLLALKAWIRTGHCGCPGPWVKRDFHECPPPSPDSSDAEQGPRLSRGARKGWWWGWLYSEQQQKLYHFRPDTATVHAQVDRHKDLRLRSASFACADDSQADAQAQRY